MINEMEVRMYLEETLPDISRELKNAGNCANIYDTVRVLLNYTFSKIRDHNYTTVKSCFKIAEKLYTRGTRTVKCAIENVFVFSFSHLPVSDPQDKKVLLGLIPGSLYSLYMQQVLNKGV